MARRIGGDDGDGAARREVPFNLAYATGAEIANIETAIARGQVSGGRGVFTERCQTWLETHTCADSAFLVTSGTAALEMAVILAEIGPGDEVIMPSYTFPSTATAVVMRGAVPVFVDVRADTLNLDERLVEAAITPRTRAIMPVHYAGVGAQMDALQAIAERHGLMLIEDAAQGITAAWRGRPLGSIGALGALSFHETKNVSSGEGGALLVNDPALRERAEIILDKGTNRAQFFRGETQSYSWVDVGSSYVLSEINAAYLAAQLDHAHRITARRLAIWQRYAEELAPLADAGIVRLPIVPAEASHNAHLFYLLASSRTERDRMLADLTARGIGAVFHYMPLHDSPAGRRFGRAHGNLTVTTDASGRLLRLPMWTGMDEVDVDAVIAAVIGCASRTRLAA